MDKSERPTHIRSYVLRQGHMTRAQERAYAEGMPRFGVPFQTTPLEMNKLFGREAPHTLEIGFGMGLATAQIAQSLPERDFIGVEVHSPGVGSLLKLIGEMALTNIRIIQHDAVEVVRDMIPPASLAAVHVFFPDPWPKKRHHKRRLLQGPFVALLASRLEKGGYLHAATDWEEYAQQMVQVFAAEPTLQNAFDNFAPRPDYRPLTKFEQRGIKLGHGVWDVIFRRR